MTPVGPVFRPGVRGISKIVIFVAALVPAGLLVRGTLTGTLGVNPAETIQLETGRWALKFLLLSLAVTPVRRITGWNIVIQYRRMLGLFAFFYATLHLLSYWSFDLGFAVGDFAADILKRPFITLGFAAFVLLRAARADVDERMDPAARKEMDRPAPAGLRLRDSRGPALHLEGESLHRRPGDLRGDPHDVAGLSPHLGHPAAAVGEKSGWHLRCLTPLCRPPGFSCRPFTPQNCHFAESPLIP